LHGTRATGAIEPWPRPRAAALVFAGSAFFSYLECVILQSICIRAFIVLTQRLCISISVGWRPSFFINFSHLIFQIKYADSVTRMRYRCASPVLCLLSESLNAAGPAPRITPSPGHGQSGFLLIHVSLASCYTSFCPGTSH
jgi:hypothetical protein